MIDRERFERIPEVSGYNLAVVPEDFWYDARIVKNYGRCLKLGEVVVIVIQDIFRDVFDDETIVLFDEMTSDDVEDWDSLSHINLIIDIEASLNIQSFLYTDCFT